MRAIAPAFLTLLLAAAPATAAEFAANRMFVASVDRDAVIEFDGAGAVVRSLGSGLLVDPRGITFGPDGLLYVTSGDEVFVFDSTGTHTGSIGPGTSLAAPRSVEFGPDGFLYATATDRVLAFDRNGNQAREIGAVPGIGSPVGIAFSAGGDLYVAAGGTNTILRFDSSGQQVDEIGAGSGLSVPMGLAFAPGGNLYVASFFGGEVLVFDADGAELPALAISDPSLTFPAGLAFGPNGNLFVTAFFGAVVMEFDAAGNKVGEFLDPAGFDNPEGIAFSPVRFHARVNGKVRRLGGDTEKIREFVTLAVAPGSQTVMLDLDDDAQDDADLASLFGATAMVFHGSNAFTDEIDVKRRFLGAQVGAPALVAGVGSLYLKIEGKLKPFGAGVAFLPKEARGTLHRSGPGVVYKGQVKTKSVLE